MTETTSSLKPKGAIKKIEDKGAIISGRIRIALALALLGIFLPAMKNNPPVMNITYTIGIILFFSFSVASIITAKKGIRYRTLIFSMVFIEASLPSMLKLSHGFDGNPYLIINETIMFAFYLFIFLFTILQNNWRLSLTAGITVVTEYILLLLVAIKVWDVPTGIGKQIPGHIMIDNEVTRILLFLSFTAVSIIIIRNMNNFAAEAENNQEVAEDRYRQVQELVDRAVAVAENLTNISSNQKEVCSHFDDLSQTQAAMSEELSASHEELTSTNESIHRSMKEQEAEGLRAENLSDDLVKTGEEVSKSTDSMHNSAGSIKTAIEETRDHIRDMTSSMERISGGGQTITNFLGIISDITDQINLLSLNASIEAARAGEHGRGFAVVADEIGKLAAATSDNSKEIGLSMQNIISDIDSGLAVAGQTGSSAETIMVRLQSIINDVTAVTDTMKNQRSTINEVQSQSRLIRERASGITTATLDQLTAMEENIKTVQNLADMSTTINQHNMEIQDYADSINSAALELKQLITER